MPTIPNQYQDLPLLSENELSDILAQSYGSRSLYMMKILEWLVPKEDRFGKTLCLKVKGTVLPLVDENFRFYAERMAFERIPLSPAEKEEPIKVKRKVKHAVNVNWHKKYNKKRVQRESIAQGN